MPVARTLTAADEGVLGGPRVLICDRDATWSAPVRARLGEAGNRVVQTPYQAPNANAYVERFVRSIKEECLNRVIPFGERHLRRAIGEFVAHYHGERHHQELGNELIDGAPPVDGVQSDSPSTAARRAPHLLLSGSVMRRDDRFHGSAHWWDLTRSDRSAVFWDIRASEQTANVWTMPRLDGDAVHPQIHRLELREPIRPLRLVLCVPHVFEARDRSGRQRGAVTQQSAQGPSRSLPRPTPCR